MSRKTTTTVKTAACTEESRVIDPIVLAFGTDPVIRWFYPDAGAYLRHFPEFLRLYAGNGFDHGAAHYVGNSAAGALWHPPGVDSDEDAMVSFIENTMSADRRKALWEVSEHLERYHPSEPYWTLRLIGVDPMQQSKGFGTALMNQQLEGCDQGQTLAYLESSNPRNISLYVRHGFEILGTVRVDSMPPLIPMLREPQG